jgi:(S)-2-hydroxyglutarate dehydrogenase
MNAAVIGGGLVGLATAWRALQANPGLSISVFEKESEVGQHQSGHNSGVLHCGLYYKPGSLKARLAVEGIRQMVEFCQEHGIAHDVCGKLVVAADESEVPRLKNLLERGRQNGLEGLAWMGPEAMREIEPHVGGVAAVRVPQEGIADFPGVSLTLRRLIEAAGGEVVTGAEVNSLVRQSSGYRISDARGRSWEAGYVISCAGLHCDRVAELGGVRRETRVLPFRGEYYLIRPERQYLVRHLIYPTPDPAFPFLGVHFTRRALGGIEAGPNAVLAFSREGYRKTDVRLADLFDALSYKGLWNFLARHRRMVTMELRRSLSKALFCQSLQRLVPEIQPDDLIAGGSGVRAQAMTPGGELVHDFDMVERPGALHVLNAPSPAATASLAIGREILLRASRTPDGSAVFRSVH